MTFIEMKDAEYNTFGKAFLKTNLVIKIAIMLFVIFVSFGRLTEVKAQNPGPAIEISSNVNSSRIMIGKNDPMDASNNNYVLTFGKGLSDAGLWNMGGSYKKGFNIGRTHNTQLPYNSPTSHSGGKHALFIDSFMNVGLDLYPHQIYYKLDVSGDTRTWGVYYSPDRRYKRDIKPISNLDNLFKLNAVQYKPSGEAFQEQLDRLPEDGKYMSESEFNDAKSRLEHIIAERNSDTTTHYGIIAQELREIYPSLVKEDKQGFLAVNYTGLIPILLDAIKELKSEINDLKGFNKPHTAEVISSARLEQNNPNPFSNNTEIKYFIPVNSVNASICIYDLNGSQMLKFEITDRGNSAITINGNLLKPGMYLYSLLVDGKEIDTKKMILTDK